MKHIIEKRVLSAHKLRGLCIVHDWCDCMTNDQYAAIFAPLKDDGTLNTLKDDDTLTTFDIKIIAELIMMGTSHENIEGYDLTDVMYEIAARCDTIFEEVDA